MAVCPSTVTLSHRRRGTRDVHAWSWIGVITAGLAQLANHGWPEKSPWPVLVVVGVATLTGAVAVPHAVSRTLVVRRRAGP